MPARRLASFVRGRAADGWLGGLVVAGGGLFLVVRRPLPLAEAVPCPGLYDLAAVIAARTSGDTPLATILSVTNALVLILALLFLGRLLHRVTASSWIAVAVGLAAASTPLFAPSLAPAPAVSIAMCAIAWLAGVRILDRPAVTRTHLAAAVAALALASGVVPVLAVPFAAAAGGLAWLVLAERTRGARAAGTAAAAAAVLALALLVLMAIPGVLSPSAAGSVFSCTWPGGSPGAGELWSPIAGALGATPIVLALAALGLVAPRRAQRVSRLPLAVAAVAVLWAGGATADDARAVAPAFLAIWVLCAAGLREVRAALGDTFGRRMGAAALAIALVVLQLLRMPDPHVPGDLVPAGHEQMSRNMFSTLIGPMPAASVLVGEDAMTDLLIRSLSGRARERRRLRVVAPNAAEIAALLKDYRVYALPRAQRRLQHLGLQFADIDGRTLNGLAEVRDVRPCPLPLTAEPRAVPELTVSNRLALVSAGARSYGPIHLFLSSETSFSARPLGWPAGATRGFLATTFDLAHGSDPRRLEDDLALYQAGHHRGLLKGPHVVHVEMWRVPGAPLILPVELGTRPAAAIGSLIEAGAETTLTVCPSLSYDVTPIGPRPRA